MSVHIYVLNVSVWLMVSVSVWSLVNVWLMVNGL